MAQDKLLNVEIITPEKTLFKGKAQSVTVPGMKSPFQVLNNHAPIVSTLETGMIKIVDDAEKSLFFASTSGFTEVRKNTVSILVDNADNATELNMDDLNSELSTFKEQLTEAKDQNESEAIKNQIMNIQNKIKAAKKAL